MTVINVNDLLHKIQNPPYTIYGSDYRCEWIEECIKNAPTIEIVCCDKCVNHGQCYVEDSFELLRLERNKRFCGVGKNKMEDKK